MSEPEVIPPGTELELFNEKYTVVDLFADAAVFEKLYEKVEAAVMSEVVDATTDEGRERIKSLAFKVTKTKTAIERARKDYVSERKRVLATIDAAGKRMFDQLELLSKKVRKPVDDYEAAEAKRVGDHETNIRAIEELGRPLANLTVANIEERIAAIKAFDVDTFEEFKTTAAGTKALAIEALDKLLVEKKEQAAQAAELKRLKDENEARNKADKAAADKREQEAREEQARKEEREKADREREAAEAKRTSDKAEAERLVAAISETVAKVNDQAKAMDIGALIQDITLSTAAAKNPEDYGEFTSLVRSAADTALSVLHPKWDAAVARETKAAEDADVERQANIQAQDKKHRGGINSAAVQALVRESEPIADGVHKLTPEQAVIVVRLIVMGKIPRVSILY